MGKGVGERREEEGDTQLQEKVRGSNWDCRCFANERVSGMYQVDLGGSLSWRQLHKCAALPERDTELVSVILSQVLLSLLIKVWSMNQQHWQYLGAC